MATKKTEACIDEDCESRRFHVGADGYTYCDRGHQQVQRGTVFAEDTGELANIGKKTLRTDSDAQSTQTLEVALTGPAAVERYLICLQLVLRKQIRWLLDVQGLPQELEVVVKDLWALRIQILSDKLRDDSGDETEGSSSRMYSSQSESENRTASQFSEQRERTIKAKSGTLTLVDSLTLCYLGVLLLRIPVTLADFHGWISSGDLLFYNAANMVPVGMRARLPTSYRVLLYQRSLVEAQVLHKAALKTINFFTLEYGMAIPSINVPLVLFSWLKTLRLPIQAFAGTQRLAASLNIDVKFDTAKARTYKISQFPEVQLMALLLVAVKLLFPLHGKPLKTAAETDLSAVSMDWDAWAKLEGHLAHDDDQKRKLLYTDAMTFGRADLAVASDGQIDDYLDWVSDNIATEDVHPRARAEETTSLFQTLFEMFPSQGKDALAGRPSNDASHAQDPDSLSILRNQDLPKPLPRRTDETAPNETPSVGSFYKKFRRPEDLVGVPRTLYMRAAKLACASLEDMVRAVFKTERMLDLHEARLRRSAAGFNE